MPGGLDATRAPPLPSACTARVPAVTKFALTVLLAVIAALQTEPLTLLHPVHLSKSVWLPADGVSSTTWPLGYSALHESSGQSMPIGLVVTRLTLAPAPVSATVRRK